MAIIKFVRSRGASPPPLELLKALMGREFHLSPEEVEHHPVDTLMKSYFLLNFFDDQVSQINKK